MPDDENWILGLMSQDEASSMDADGLAYVKEVEWSNLFGADGRGTEPAYKMAG